MRDFLLAAVFTFCALTYWIWNERPDAVQNVPATATQNDPGGTSQSPPAVQAPADAQFTQLTNEGLRLYQNRDYSGAEDYFRRALVVRPDAALAYNNLGAALNSANKYREAIPILEKAIALDPNLALARNNLVVAYQEIAKHGK